MHKIRFRRARGHGAPRKRMSYASVAATLALVLALGGGTAWAAHHYLITSTSQIKPNVLKSLRGYRGYRGYTGTKGTNGTNGTNGATGPTGGTGAIGAPNPNATTVNGQSVTPIFATVAPGAAAVQVYSGQGLTLLFSCPTSTNDQVVANGPASTADNLVVQGNGNSGAFQARFEDLGPSTAAVIGSGNYGTGVAEYGTSDGHVVSVTYGFDDAPSGISANCSIWGHAVSG